MYREIIDGVLFDLLWFYNFLQMQIHVLIKSQINVNPIEYSIHSWENNYKAIINSMYDFPAIFFQR